MTYKEGKNMMSESKFYMGYSRWIEEEQRNETWKEAVARVMGMHRQKYANVMSQELEEMFQFAEEAYLNKEVLGAQRALQFGGEQIFKHESRMYNCSVSYADRPNFFSETFYLLLSGCGVGFSVQRHHIDRLPTVARRSTKKAKIFQIPDSIEGWSDSIAVLLSSYFTDGAKFPEYKGSQVHFDFSKIRPRGSFISGGFKAPGPDGLRASLIKCEELIEEYLKDAPVKKLNSITVYDIVMHIADAVLSGGVRRSATLCMFDKDDNDMLTAKTGNWFPKNPQRGRSNNSAVIIRNEITREEWANIVKHVKQFGEPGFIFAESREHLNNPCVEVGMLPRTEDGVSGFQFCVSGDTKLITRDGIVNIEDAVGKDIEIWNGEEWSAVSPFKTGENDALYRVHFSDGSYLDATANHKFLVKNRFQKEFQEMETVEIIEHMKNAKYHLHAPRPNIVYDGGISAPDAYDFGFILGDGCATRKDVTCGLFGNDKHLNFTSVSSLKKYKNYNGTDFTLTTFNVDLEFAKKLKYENGLPPELFSWDRTSILKFIAGWADADGTKASKGIRIAGREDKLRDAQLLLTKIGIECSLNLAQKTGTKTNLGERKNDLWYIQITKTLEIPCQRLKCDNVEHPKFKGKNQIIKRIDIIEGTHKSYCLSEEKLHQCVFNNVLTKQCNLSEINGMLATSTQKFLRMCKAAAILGTLQAGYTDFKYLTPASKQITDREALIGVGITGWMNNPQVLFDEENMKAGAEEVKAANKYVASLIGINPSARCTVVKPSGNASVVLGCASGIHAEHSQRYIRHIQMSDTDDVARIIKEKNPKMVEKSVWGANDVVVAFPIETPETSIFKSQLTGVEQLEYVKRAQAGWIEHGTNVDLCVDPTLRHNVSNTITVDDWAEVEQYIFDNRKWFAGISLLSSYGDRGYVQAPFTEVFTAEQIFEAYGTGALFASGLIVDAGHAFGDSLWSACDQVLGHGIELDPENSDHLLKRDWVRRANKFAANYFGGDLVKMTFCLKDCYNRHKWDNIVREMQPIDFSVELGKKQFVDADSLGAIACGGGACEITF